MSRTTRPRSNDPFPEDSSEGKAPYRVRESHAVTIGGVTWKAGEIVILTSARAGAIGPHLIRPVGQSSELQAAGEGAGRTRAIDPGERRGIKARTR